MRDEYQKEFEKFEDLAAERYRLAEQVGEDMPVAEKSRVENEVRVSGEQVNKMTKDAIAEAESRCACLDSEEPMGNRNLPRGSGGNRRDTPDGSSTSDGSGSTPRKGWRRTR